MEVVDIERALLARVIQAAQIEQAVQLGVNETWFADAKHRQIWQFITEHWRTYGVCPSVQAVGTAFQNVDLPVVTDSVAYLADQTKLRAKYRTVVRALEDVMGLMRDGDPKVLANIDLILLERARKALQESPGGEVERFSAMNKRVLEYEAQVAEGRSPIGIKMGIPEIDRATLGIQPHEMVTIMGFSGIGKSTLLQWILYNAYLQGKTVMLFSMEVQARAVMRKWDAMATKMSYNSLKGLDLPADTLDQWREVSMKIAENKHDIIVPCDVRDCTVDRIQSDIIRYQPDIIGIDYISLMKTSQKFSSQWEKLTELTRDLKQLSHSLQVPIVAVAQSGRDSATAGAQKENVAYSLSIIQDSDIVLGLHRDDEMRANNQMKVYTVKNRDGREVQVTMRWNLDTMDISEFMMAQFAPPPQPPAPDVPEVAP